MRLYSIFSLIIIMVLPFIHSCGHGNTVSHNDGGDTIPLKYAKNIMMVDYGDYLVVTLRNPWDTTKMLHTYLLVPDSIEPEGMPQGTIIRTPLTNAVVYAATHNALISELGAAEAVTGVCDPQYIHDSIIVERLKGGLVIDCGDNMSPNLEKIMQLHPQAVLLSPYEGNNGYGKLSKLGIPIVECADYMESSPLARAEWMKFFGRLVGRSDEADALFALTDSVYNSLKELSAMSSTRPRVLLDRMYGSVWNVPGAHSTMDQMIEDAGGKNIFDYIDKAGSAPLSPEQVLNEAYDADVWLIRYNQPDELTYTQLGKDNTLYRQFAPYKNGNVYGCNTNKANLYDVMPFHPQLILADMISVLHPEVKLPEHNLNYFVPLLD